MIKVTPAMVASAAAAIEECMANDGWKVSGITRYRLKKCVSLAAEKAVKAALDCAAESNLEKFGAGHPGIRRS